MTAAVVPASTSPCCYGNWRSHSPACRLRLLPVLLLCKGWKIDFQKLLCERLPLKPHILHAES